MHIIIVNKHLDIPKKSSKIGVLSTKRSHTFRSPAVVNFLLLLSGFGRASQALPVDASPVERAIA